MSSTPSPPGWVIPNADAQAFSFVDAVNGVDSLSDQALTIDASSGAAPVILPDNSPGNIAETRVEFAVMDRQNSGFSSAGIVFAFQDLNNSLGIETLVRPDDGTIENIHVAERVNGSNTLLKSFDSALSLDPSQGWVDLRFQVFRPSSSEVSIRVSAANHGNKYQSLGTTTFADSQLNFITGDVGLTAGRQANATKVAVDGDPVGSGGRPIKMYWA